MCLPLNAKQSFKENFENYRKIWVKPNQNHKEGNDKTSLNKELRKKSRLLTQEEINIYAEKRVQWQMNIRDGTPNKMSADEYRARVDWLKQRKYNVELTRVLK